MKKQNVALCERRLLSVNEFQLYTGIGRNNAYKLIQESGCGIHFGRRVFADRVQFDHWCEAQTR
ncbi:MAG: hypothetical protein ACLTKI_01870 [Lachnospiraceae bacterium]